MKTIRIKYLSNGPENTGGYFHEKFWFEQLQEFYKNKGYKVIATSERPDFYHSGFGTILKWFVHLFAAGKADLVLVPGRCALPVILRNVFSKRKAWVVLHSLNTRELKERKSKAMYYALLFGLMRLAKNTSLITVAHFWKNFFSEKTAIPLDRIFVLPNLFDYEDYRHYQTDRKEKSVHLGMWSAKLDKTVYEIASYLSHRGYYCFFTTSEDIMSIGAYGYDIVYCPTLNEYKKRVAQAMFTLAFSAIPEGWSRVAHESFLLGTPVIGTDNAGQGELIREANGFLVENTVNTLELIDLKAGWKLPERFIEKYHSKRAGKILDLLPLNGLH